MTRPGPAGTRPSLGATIGLGVLLTLGPLLVLAPSIWLVAPVTDLPEPFVDHHQTAETAIFLLAFAVLLPAGVAGGLQIADRIAAGPDPGALSVAVWRLGAGLALVVLADRVLPELALGARPRVLALGAALWCGTAALLLARAASRPRLPDGDRHRARWSRPLAALLLVPVALSFVQLGGISIAALVAGAAVALAATVLHERARPPRLPPAAGGALDLALIVLLGLAVPDLFVVPMGDPARALESAIIQFHQNFYLGPARQLLSGDHMLVEVLSQYGVGSIGVLAAVFGVVPIGYGTLGLIEGALSASTFVATFALLRMAGVSRWMAATAMGVAVVTLVYGLAYPLGALLQHGAFRFGHPVGVVLGGVVEARWRRLALPARLLQLLTLAVASIWALEAFVFTLFTLAAVAAVGVVARPAGSRARAVVAWGAQIGAAVLLAHVLFAGTTFAAAGELPRWGWYLATVREFLVGSISAWTYDFSTFSAGYAVGALYLGSAAALAIVTLRRPDLRQTEQTLLVAIAGMTAYGIALLSYLVNRSADHIIPYVSLPVVALGALWPTFVGRGSVAASVASRRAALGAAFALSGVALAAAWTTAEIRFPESALAYAVAGRAPLQAAIGRLWRPPPLRAEAPEGVALLRAQMPNERRSIVLTGADLSVEILLRAGRANAVPFGDPWEDSFVASSHLAPLGAFVDRLRQGDLTLIDAPARGAFEAHRADPALDPLEPATGPTEMAPLQKWVLREIGLRFDLRTVARGGSGLEVAELVPRAAQARPTRGQDAAVGRRALGRWQIATMSSASCRRSFRSAKSPTSIASARGSGLSR